jgi:hypothetical protein
LPVVEPPQPGDRIVVLYREGESRFDMYAVLATVVSGVDHSLAAHLAGSSGSFVWFCGAADEILCRALDDEGVEWARVTHVQAEARGIRGGWTDVVPALVAARRLAGTGR